MNHAKMVAPRSASAKGPSLPLVRGLQQWLLWPGIEGFFVVCSLLPGLALLILTPPFQVPDEGAHFYRAFQVSQGRIVSQKRGEFTGDELPSSFQAVADIFEPLRMRGERKISFDEIRQAGRIEIQSDQRRFIPFSNTAIHSPLAYLPQAAGILLVRPFSSSVLVPFYAGRLANLLAFTALVALAIRRTPVLKWALAALALSPMSLFLAASLSSDALTNAICFLLLAQVVHCAAGRQEQIGRRDLVILVLLSAAIGLVKQAYFPLVLSYFLIPLRRIEDRRRYWASFGLLLASLLLAAGTWALVVRASYSPVVPGKVDPAAQWHFLCDHPGDFGMAILRSLTVDLPGTLAEYVGVLGVLDVPLPRWLAPVYLLVLALAALAGWTSDKPILGRQALLALAIAVLDVLCILLVIHLTWDKVGPAASIDVQGRYFIPLGLLFLLPLAWLGSLGLGRVDVLARFMPVLVAVTAPTLLLVAAARLHDRYFHDTPQDAAERAFDLGSTQLRQTGSQVDAIHSFQEAVKHNPRHSRAHFNLGVLLANTQPEQAISHYENALAVEPDFQEARVNLANLLARQGEFDRAIEHYRQALERSPDEITRRGLAQAMKDQEKLHTALQRIGAAVLTCARTQVQHDQLGTSREGLYLIPNQGEVRTAEGRSALPQLVFLWRSPPPAGGPIQLFDVGGKPFLAPQHPRFYACATTRIGPRRIFVFQPPLEAVLLRDEEVSWLYQMRMSDLDSSERDRELDYRRRHQLIFPLDLDQQANRGVRR